jgi:hypothetical protein
VHEFHSLRTIFITFAPESYIEEIIDF